MKTQAKIIVPALAILLVGGAALTARSSTMSLATDLGYDDATLCSTLDAFGKEAVARLEAAGFPHATRQSVEVYRLLQGDTVEAVLRIDWLAQTASCLPLDHAGAVSADVRMTPKAYAALVGELQGVIATGDLGVRPGNLIPIWQGTDVTIPSAPASGNAYELQVALWSAGILADWMMDGGS